MGIAGQLAGIRIQIHVGPCPGDFELSIFQGNNPPAGAALVLVPGVEDGVADLAQGTVRHPAGDFAGRFSFGFRLPVSKCDFLDLIVDPGPIGDSSCDTTWAEITIVGSPPRN